MAINILQELGLAEDPNAPLPAPVIDSNGGMFGMRPPVDPMAQQMPTQAPRQRRSFIDTIGQLSDVFARVGGAEALYQPTIDARDDRARALELEGLTKQQTQQKLALGNEELAALQRAKVGMTIKGLQAIRQAGGDINRALPLLGERSGMSPEEISALGNVIQSDANALDGLAAQFGAEDKPEFGLQPFYTKDAKGNLRAYQIGKDGRVQQIQLGEGESPIDPLKFVDTGNQQVGVGSRSGTPLRILPKGQSPDNRANNQARITVAGMRGTGRGGAKDAPDPAAIARGAQPVVTALKQAVETLYSSGGMTSGESGVRGTAEAIARENIPGLERFTSPEGFSAREDFKRLTTVGIPALLPLMGGLTIGGKNIDAAKELETWRNAIASAKDYPSAMRAIAGFEARIAELTKQADRAPAAAPNAAPRRNVAPRRNTSGGNKPSVSNW